MSKIWKKAAKIAGEWLIAETRSILQEKGRFKSTEHTKSLYSIMAEELDKIGYCKKEKIVRAVLTEVLGYCADDEVGMKYLIKRTAKKYGVVSQGHIFVEEEVEYDNTEV